MAINPSSKPASKTYISIKELPPLPTKDVRNGSTHHHRDGLGRVSERDDYDKSMDWFLDPKDGRIQPLRVQQAKHLNDPMPTALRIVFGMFSLPIVLAIILWVPASWLLQFVMLWPRNLEGHVRNNGWYDPVRYRDWKYSRSARNPCEDCNKKTEDNSDEDLPLLGHELKDDPELALRSSDAVYRSKQQKLGSTNRAMIKRLHGPRYLCFLRQTNGTKDNKRLYHTRLVADWMRDHGQEAAPTYVFVSYTRRQFNTPNGIGAERLIERAITAAKAAYVQAFWIDFECIKTDREIDTDDSILADAFRICDIVRAAYSMIIVLGPPVDSPREHYSQAAKARWFKQWGSRLWTVPEALLCPAEQRIGIYAIGDTQGPELVAKRNIPSRCWSLDADEMRELVDHYEGTISLTPLELVSTALRCLQRRQTLMMSHGDVSYALMGLLRRRPTVNTSDSDFEAFARLSLANDSDLLLERLLCMLPPKPDALWHHDFEDAWGQQLWDFDPLVQVAGIVDNRTVLLDGAYGATIRWDKLKQVAFLKRKTVGRQVLAFLVRGLPGLFLSGLIMSAWGAIQLFLASSQSIVLPPVMIAGLVVNGVCALLSCLVPFGIRALYCGKFWDTQAYFFGMEGIPDLGYVERRLFGRDEGRLKWSTNGSKLSKHRLVDGECQAIAPIDNGRDQKWLKLYTIVDTFTMTATAFYAERPPTAVMVCGREGGMQRAALCSYDWQTQTFVRETVVRMKTLTLERMRRVDRFRFCLTREGRET